MVWLRGFPKITCLVRDTAKIHNNSGFCIYVLSIPLQWLFQGPWERSSSRICQHLPSHFVPLSFFKSRRGTPTPGTPSPESLSSYPSEKNFKMETLIPKPQASMPYSSVLILKSSSSSQIQLDALGLTHRPNQTLYDRSHSRFRS